MDPVRTLIDRTVRDRGLKLSDLSKAVGKNHAYLQQFLSRGIPAKLPEDVRARLADAIGLDETLLGGKLKTSPYRDEEPTKSLPEYDIRAGAAYGGGLESSTYQDGDFSGHKPSAQWGLPSAYVEKEVGLRFGLADIIAVQGDSMDDGTRYALMSGDRVIVDRQAVNVRQGGIFVIWDGDSHIIKQVELVRGSDPPAIICKSLNKRYADFTIVLDENARIIGRVAVKISRM